MRKKRIMKKAVTIKDIAEALDLSRNTVSKALNGQHVPEKTREQVLKKAQELNYKSFNTDFFKSNKYRILLLSGKPYHNMHFFGPLVKGIEEFCYDNDYDFFEYTYNSKATSFNKIANYIKSLNVDGIVAIECFEMDFVLNLLSLDIPTCFIDFPVHRFVDTYKYDLLCASDQRLLSDYVKTLINNYHIKHFTFVGDYRHCLSFHERYMGMLRGLDRTGISHSKNDDILEDDKTFDYGDVNAIKAKIQSLKHLPECFICCNDFVARKVVTAATQLGHKIPEDTLVVGFDDGPESMLANPQITTFAVDKEFLGQEAIRTLLTRIERRKTPSRTITINCDLIIRESTKK